MIKVVALDQLDQRDLRDQQLRELVHEVKDLDFETFPPGCSRNLPQSEEMSRRTLPVQLRPVNLGLDVGLLDFSRGDRCLRDVN